MTLRQRCSTSASPGTVSWRGTTARSDWPVQTARGYRTRTRGRKVESLIGNPAIIRNRLKIECAIGNARAYLELQSSLGGFSEYIWSFVDGEPVQNRWRNQDQVPATSPISDALSKDLKKRGFKFVGSTIIYAHMQATGLVNDHVVGCYRYKECRALA